MTQFWGWVPNTTGAISFTQIGSQCGHDLLYDKTRNTEKACHVVSIQNRTLPLDDSLFDLRTRLQNSILGKEDTFFALSAECRKRHISSDCLTGKISCRFGKINKDNVHNFRNLTELVFEVTFRLKRNGMCGFRNISISHDILIYEGDRKYFEEYLVAQSYMFLRDLVHRHKHHDPKSDTFLDLQTIPQTTNPQTAIKKKVAYDLGKMVITNPLENEPETIQDALGILAYLASFQKSADTEVYSSQHLVSTKASLDAEYSRVSLRLTSYRWACGITLGLYYFINKAVEQLSFSSPIEWNNYKVIYLTFLTAMILYMAQITKVIDLRKTKLSMELSRVLPYYKFPTAIAIIFAIVIFIKIISKILS